MGTNSDKIKQLENQIEDLQMKLENQMMSRRYNLEVHWIKEEDGEDV